MKFEVWSIWHFIYILSPFIFTIMIYQLVKNKSDKVKDIVGIIIAILNIGILILRNIDIYLRNGWDLEVVPLQVCHLGNIIVGLSLLTKKKWLMLTGFCFHFIPALAAMIFAEALANYDTILKIRPQTYIWGHIFICVGGVYAFLINKPKFTKIDFKISLSYLVIMLLIAIISNSLFRYLLAWEPNYFYIFNSKGTPFGFIYNLAPAIKIGWFEINIIYTLAMILMFSAMYAFMYFISKYLYKSESSSKKVD